MPSLFPERLSGLRAQSGLSQEKFAALLNLSKSALANYEAGTREPNYATLIKIADILGVTLDHLLGRTPPLSALSLELQLAFLHNGLRTGRFTLEGEPIPPLLKRLIEIPLHSVDRVIQAVSEERP